MADTKTAAVPLWVAILVANRIKDPATRAAQLFNLGIRGGQSPAQVERTVQRIKRQAIKEFRDG